MRSVARDHQQGDPELGEGWDASNASIGSTGSTDSTGSRLAVETNLEQPSSGVRRHSPTSVAMEEGDEVTVLARMNHRRRYKRTAANSGCRQWFEDSAQGYCQWLQKMPQGSCQYFADYQDYGVPQEARDICRNMLCRNVTVTSIAFMVASIPFVIRWAVINLLAAIVILIVTMLSFLLRLFCLLLQCCCKLSVMFGLRKPDDRSWGDYLVAVIWSKIFVVGSISVVCTVMVFSRTSLALFVIAAVAIVQVFVYTELSIKNWMLSRMMLVPPKSR